MSDRITQIENPMQLKKSKTKRYTSNCLLLNLKDIKLVEWAADEDQTGASASVQQRGSEESEWSHRSAQPSISTLLPITVQHHTQQTPPVLLHRLFHLALFASDSSFQ